MYPQFSGGLIPMRLSTQITHALSVLSLGRTCRRGSSSSLRKGSQLEQWEFPRH